MDMAKLARQKKWGELIYQLENNSEQVFQTFQIKYSCGTTNECLLIHHVCMHKPPRQVLVSLLEVFPDSIALQDSIGRLPLHHAIRYNASYSVIDFLISKYPEGAKVKTYNDGCLPLHFACLYPHLEGSCLSVDITLITKLITVFPESVHEIDMQALFGRDDNRPDDFSDRNIIRRIINCVKAIATSTRGTSTEETNIITHGVAYPDIVDYPTYEITVGTSTSSSNSSNQDTQDHHSDDVDTRIDDNNDVIVIDGDDENSIDYSETECIVCMDKRATCLLEPCGHICLCDSCSTRNHLVDMRYKCPLCRCAIEAVIVM